MCSFLYIIKIFLLEDPDPKPEFFCYSDPDPYYFQITGSGPHYNDADPKHDPYNAWRDLK